MPNGRPAKQKVQVDAVRAPALGDAVRNGWAIVLDVTGSDGGHVALTASCK